MSEFTTAEADVCGKLALMCGSCTAGYRQWLLHIDMDEPKAYEMLALSRSCCISLYRPSLHRELGPLFMILVLNLSQLQPPGILSARDYHTWHSQILLSSSFQRSFDSGSFLALIVQFLIWEIFSFWKSLEVSSFFISETFWFQR